MKTITLISILTLTITNTALAQAGPSYNGYNDYMYDDSRTQSTVGQVFTDDTDYTHGYDSYDASVTPEDNIYVADEDVVYVDSSGRYGHRPRARAQDRLSREEYETRVARENARRRHLDNSTTRDDSYTELYGSNTRREERSNVMQSINEASDTVRNISNTINYIQNLF
jgi:hypothetical protein